MNIPELFGIDVFNDDEMKARLPENIYKSLKKTINEGKHIDFETAQAVANAMKDWALEKGATHYTHWFQPMTGITAEKHDSFISPTKNGGAIMEFSGKELIKGESDASSFPSGGLRATFEARGYTAWDPTSFAFIKDGSLCIPTAFCAYGGQALDKKTPLLRSMEAVNKQAIRILKLFGKDDVKRVTPTVGPEQEYFLIDKTLFDARKDLLITGRTLFGLKPSKGQELDDHYYGAIRPRVSEYMKDLDTELWKLGVYAKTKHNEVAPAQHELAPIFTTTNIAADHNQITMEVMKKTAERHNLVCLLHEKPFAGVNGSGKHNNWSLSTNTGINLFEPGSTPFENAQFLLFFSAVIKAVDEYQDLLRVSVASAGNDHRLGANEAPPAIISMFIGEELEEIIDAIDHGSTYRQKAKKIMKLGVDSMPDIPMDTTDRNRTSPFAFTGNKFEFRMLGSAFSISDSNTVLNTIVAEELRLFADELENAKDFNTALNKLVAKTIKDHKRIIFNGNNYSGEWVLEADKRGLLNLKSSDEAIPHFKAEKNIILFERHGVMTRAEIESRTEIMLESYVKTINIEALTMVDMAKKEIYPAVNEYLLTLGNVIKTKRDVCPDFDNSSEVSLFKKLSKINNEILETAKYIEILLSSTNKLSTNTSLATFYRKEVFTSMTKLRALTDEAEGLVGKEYWPMPDYTDLLFSV